MDRRPIVAGRFYPGDPDELRAEVSARLSRAEPQRKRPTLLAMAPHAGYMFSGGVAGLTLGAARLPGTIVLLGPNHTGMDKAVAVWPEGRWIIPTGAVEVDAELAAELVAEDARLATDTSAHAREHSLEVMLPFLHALNPAVKIVPVVVAAPRLEDLLAVGQALAKVLARRKGEAAMVVSSDMSHYVSAKQAKRLDFMALERIRDLDPAGLLATVRENGISMCGVMPMTAGLAAAVSLGADTAEVVAYATSGEVNRDLSSVVGYAGVLVEGKTP